MKVVLFMFPDCTNQMKCQFKVDEGFTEEESLKLLAKCVDLDVSKLPVEAKQIHYHGKGIVKNNTLSSIICKCDSSYNV